MKAKDFKKLLIAIFENTEKIDYGMVKEAKSKTLSEALVDLAKAVDKGGTDKREVAVKSLTDLPENLSKEEIRFIYENFTPRQMTLMKSREKYERMVEQKAIAHAKATYNLLTRKNEAFFNKNEGYFQYSLDIGIPPQVEIKSMVFEDKKRLIEELKEMRQEFSTAEKFYSFFKNYVTTTYEFDELEQEAKDIVTERFYKKYKNYPTHNIYSWRFERTDRTHLEPSDVFVPLDEEMMKVKAEYQSRFRKVVAEKRKKREEKKKNKGVGQSGKKSKK